MNSYQARQYYHTELNKDGQPLYGLNNKLLQINFVKIVNVDY